MRTALKTDDHGDNTITLWRLTYTETTNTGERVVKKDVTEYYLGRRHPTRWRRAEPGRNNVNVMSCKVDVGGLEWQ